MLDNKTDIIYCESLDNNILLFIITSKVIALTMNKSSGNTTIHLDGGKTFVSKEHVGILKAKLAGIPEKVIGFSIKEIIKRFAKLEKTKEGFKTNCPFHEDKSQSLVINTKTNLFHCYSCGESGGGLDFVMKVSDNPSLEKAKHFIEGNYIYDE